LDARVLEQQSPSGVAHPELPVCDHEGFLRGRAFLKHIFDGRRAVGFNTKRAKAFSSIRRSFSLFVGV